MRSPRGAETKRYQPLLDRGDLDRIVAASIWLETIAEGLMGRLKTLRYASGANLGRIRDSSGFSWCLLVSCRTLLLSSYVCSPQSKPGLRQEPANCAARPRPSPPPWPPR